jgi:uncharacterized Zn-binding protein involved in type VI secretion
MGFPAARITDTHVCPMVTGIVPHVGGPIVSGMPTVITGGMPQARVTDVAVCVGPPDMIVKGSATVLVGGLPAARILDNTVHGGVIVTGFPTVLIGDAGAAGGGGGAGGAGVGVAPPGSGIAPLSDPNVQAGMRQAWADSQAGDAANRHEEGGYIVKNADGSFGVERWPRGAGASIMPPARDANGRYNGKDVVGEFHTHPNPPVDENGKHWTPGGHQGDWDGIRAENYPGDSYIISRDSVWLVQPDGTPARDGHGNEVPIGSHDAVLNP